MRFLSNLFIGLLLPVVLCAQSKKEQSAWIVDDFNTAQLKSEWMQVGGAWKVADDMASLETASAENGLVYAKYIMRTKPYTVETNVNGIGGGLVFCLEHPNTLTNGHVVFLNENNISTGYFDFRGRYVETRVVNYNTPRSSVLLRVRVNPLNRTYSITVQDRDVVLEELRYISGYAGLYAKTARTSFDHLQVVGEGKADTPSFYMKSNKRQIDHISYFTILDESLIVVNPIVSIVQRLTSVGSYVQEIQVQGKNTSLRGVCVDEKKWIYVVDGVQKAVRIYNNENILERVISSDLTDPRGVAVSGDFIYVLDSDGIKVFDSKGSFISAKALGIFKDPKNIFYSNGVFCVADFGNGQVQVLNKGDFSVRQIIKEQLVSPWDVCVDEENQHIYIADPGVCAVFHFDEKGNFVERMEPITIKGFISPRAVRIRQNMLYVGDFERILGFKKDVLAIRPTFKIE